MKILDVPKSGKCGQVVAFKSRFGLCLREWLAPRNTITPAREHMRAIFGRNSRMWSGKLTEEQRNRWNAAGPQVMSYPRLGQQGPLTGQQFWQSISSVRAAVGLAPDLEPPAPVIFNRSGVGRLVIENTEDGVRLWLVVSGELDTDIMIFGQEPCPSGRQKRRNVAYLGLVPPPVNGRSEITHLYKARYGEPRPGRKVFIVTCQQKNGWKGLDQETSEIVPDLPKGFQAASETADSEILHMHKGCTRDDVGGGWRAAGQSRESSEPGVGSGIAAGAALAGVGAAAGAGSGGHGRGGS